MKERFTLALLVAALVVGLAAWWLFDRDRSVPDAALLAQLDPQPPIGEPLGDDERTGLAAALEGRVVRLFRRGDAEVLAVVTSGDEALDALARTRAAVSGHGGTAALLGPGREVAALREDATVAGPDVAAPLRLASARRIPRVETDALSALGEPPEHEPERIAVLYDPVLGLSWPEVAIGVFPPLEPPSAAAPLAWLAFGNYRGCPDTATHVAVVEHLGERFGAVLTAITHDGLTLTLEPPLVEDAARIEAAQVLAAYAPSLLRRPDGTERTVLELAQEVTGRSTWALRWPRPR